MTPTLSICIVVRNAASDLELTLISIDQQVKWLKRLPTEVVIVEGHSTDSSLMIAENWAKNCKMPVHIISQLPRGIYPAMNEAWTQAHGRWLLFINAGDLLLDAASLGSALASAKTEGHRSIQFQAAMFIPRASRGIWIPSVYPACHQSLVYQRDLHQAWGPYDERFNVCADRLFDQQIRSEGRLLNATVLSATQVSPANTSRNPDLLRKDLQETRRLGIPFKLASPPWITFLVLRLEQSIGFSFSVWFRLWLRVLSGNAKWVSLY
jgi:glycosyltransferase involved in cell wall biosynthesis